MREAPVPDAARLIAEETVAASGNGSHGGNGSRAANVGYESSSPWGEHGVRGADLAEDLAKFVEWPVRYDVEVVSKSALLRNLPPEYPDVSGRSPDADGEEKETTRTTPFVGIAVAPWLRWAALREKEDDLADHAAAPHLLPLRRQRPEGLRPLLPQGQDRQGRRQNHNKKDRREIGRQENNSKGDHRRWWRRQRLAAGLRTSSCVRFSRPGPIRRVALK